MAGLGIGMKAVAAGGEDAAEQIARLLREGRAAEVTDEMLGALGPNDQAKLFELYESGATGMDLPMDEASRLARAKERGFGGPLYHGTKSDVAAFASDRIGASDDGLAGKGFYSTYNPEEASGYALNETFGNGDAPNVMPVNNAIKDPLVIDAGKMPDGRSLREIHGGPINSQGGNAVRRVAEDAGNDGIVFARTGGGVGHSVAWAPEQVRSRHARFDPRLSKNADLLASRAAPGGMGDYSTQEARAAPRGVMAIPMRPSSPSMPSGAGPSLSDALSRVAQAFGTAGRAGIEGMATALSGVDEQGRSVGSILPFAKDERTGEVGLASPRILDLWNTAGGVVPAKGVTLGAGPVMRGADSALDMSQEARMARAREMGFEIDAYKGMAAHSGGPTYTSSMDGMKLVEDAPWVPITEIKSPGSHLGGGYAGFFSDDPKVANRFVEWMGDDNSQVVSAKIRMENPVEIDMAGKMAAYAQFDGLAGADKEAIAKVRRALEDPDVDGIILRNTGDEGTVFIPKNSNQIRSRFAAFDPAKRDSTDLLASRVAPGSLGIGGERRLTYRDVEDWL